MFKDDDIEGSLGFSGDDKFGSYNNLDWSTYTGSDATDPISQLITLHEYAHNELNNMSAYGCLLQVYAYLAKIAGEDRLKYKMIVGDLINCCRTTHEVYATWYSVSSFKENADDNSVEILLAGNKEYEEYYNMADNLFKEIPGLFLRSAVFISVINFCFQSKEIAHCAANDFENFSIGKIRISEFPNQRFTKICEQFTPSFFSKLVFDYVESRKSFTDYPFLKNELSEEGPGIDMSMDDLLIIGTGLNNHVQYIVNDYFESINSSSFLDEKHMDFFKEILEKVYQAYPLENHSLIMNCEPYNVERTMAINFESETLLFTDAPLDCIIIQPEHLAPELIMELQNNTAGILIWGRHTGTLEGQYSFVHEQDKLWFQEHQNALTFIRFISKIDNRKVIVIVPFLNPDDLLNFINIIHEEGRFSGCVSVSAASQEEWWDKWADFFALQCSSFSYLNDASLLYLLENYFHDKENVTYCKIEVVALRKKYVLLLFEFCVDGELYLQMTTPCSETFYSFADHYIKKYFPAYVYKSSLIEENQEKMQLMFAPLFSEEYSFYFRTMGIADKLFQ